jgi:hypothetical protein
MDQQGEPVVEVDEEQLAAPADVDDRRALDGGERRIEGLQRVDAGCQRRLDRRSGRSLGDAPGGDLNFW